MNNNTNNEERDDKLLEYMSWKDKDRKKAEWAFNIFYSRHVDYLEGLFEIRMKNLLDQKGFESEDIVQETFHRAYEKARTFKSEGETDPDRLRKRTRAWLGRIARNLLLPDHRSSSVLAIYLMEDLEHFADLRGGESETHGNMIKWSREARDKCLDERERYILSVFADHYDPRKVINRHPNWVIEELRKLFNTTSANIRQIRARAKRKVKEYVERKIDELKKESGENDGDE